MFSESLAEFLKMNESIENVDISCNQISESNASTLKDSLEGNPNMIQIDVRSNDLTPETVEEINEIVMKNYLKQQKISYHKISDSKSPPFFKVFSDGQGD